MTTLDIPSLAAELLDAYAGRREVSSPSSRDAGFDMDAAYAVESEIVRIRTASGRRTTGLKVGFANKAMWRALKLETLVWAHMYDDTVHYATNHQASLSTSRMIAPKIEPEIVFKMRQPLEGSTDPAAILASAEWLAPGFEIIDCAFPGWQFQPVDFVAALGLHAALVIGQPLPVTADNIPLLADGLPRFKVRLMKNGNLVEEGSGKNSLKSPALCLGELAGAISRRAGTQPLAAGDLVSSGTLTTPALVAAGEEWSIDVEDLGLPGLRLKFT